MYFGCQHSESLMIWLATTCHCSGLCAYGNLWLKKNYPTSIKLVCEKHTVWCAAIEWFLSYFFVKWDSFNHLLLGLSVLRLVRFSSPTPPILNEMFQRELYNLGKDIVCSFPLLSNVQKPQTTKIMLIYATRPVSQSWRL